MHGIVNRRAAEARREAEFIAGQLASDFGEAKAENLEARRSELARAEKEKARIGRAQAALAEGLKVAQAVRSARREVERLEREVRAEEERRAKALADRERAARQREEFDRSLQAAQDRLAAAGFDEKRHLTLVAAKPRAEQLHEVGPKLDRLQKECREAEGDLERKWAELQQVEKALPGLERAAERKKAEAEAARAEREELRRRHAAHELRRHLKRGEKCPVCEQVVKSVPKGRAPALDAAEDAALAAEKAAEEARGGVGEARIHLKGLRGEVSALEKELAQRQRQRDEAAASIESLRQALRAAGFTAKDTADARAPLARLLKELSELERAKAERDGLEAERKRLEEERAELNATITRAEAQKEAAESRVAELQERHKKASGDLEGSKGALADLARREGWEGLEPGPGQDEADILELRRRALEKEDTARAESMARLRAEVERLERAIARAAELEERRKALEVDAALAATLAQHLQANQFIAHVQEEALRVLAEDGSRHLRTLSQGRYSLASDSQDFFVVDHWNADMQRSVKTLSGGETFLASLALALALAERLAELSAEGRAGETLESLFLDEGFGTLDAETLDVVVQAIEALHGGHRMVGVVTHIPDLAERLPARVNVSRSGASATVSTA